MRRAWLFVLIGAVALSACVGPKWRTVEGEAVSSEMLKDCSQFAYKLEQTDPSDTEEVKRVAEIARASCPREDWIKVAPVACLAIEFGCNDVVMTEFEDE
jgi:hypothetical protein